MICRLIAYVNIFRKKSQNRLKEPIWIDKDTSNTDNTKYGFKVKIWFISLLFPDHLCQYNQVWDLCMWVSLFNCQFIKVLKASLLVSNIHSSVNKSWSYVILQSWFFGLRQSLLISIRHCEMKFGMWWSQCVGWSLKYESAVNSACHFSVVVLLQSCASCRIELRIQIQFWNFTLNLTGGSKYYADLLKFITFRVT